MEKEEREFVLRHLADSRERLIRTVDGLSQEQRYFRSAEDRWSIAECVEHITVTESLFFKKVQEAAQAPPGPRCGAGCAQQGPVNSRAGSRPRHSPEGPGRVDANPGRWTDFEELLRQFESWRERSLRFAAVTQANLRIHFFEHPRLGDLDCYQ